MTASMLAFCSSAPSSNPAGPAPTMATCVLARIAPEFIVDYSGSLHLGRILHCLLHVELDVVELVAHRGHALDLPDVDVLNDVARLRVDEDRAARALEDLALHRREQRVATTCALGGGERVVDQVHAC